MAKKIFDFNEFREQVRKELKKNELNRKQIVLFAWRCAVRAFPFWVTSEFFNSGKEGLMTHTYSLVRGIDAAYAAAAAYDDAADAAAAYHKIDLQDIILNDIGYSNLTY